MSLFGTPEPDETPSMHSSFARSRQSLFDEEDSMTASHSNSLFQDDDTIAGSRTGSPWDMPTPRKQQTRADLLRSILPASDVPDSYIETFDDVVREHGSGGRVTSAGVTRVLAAAKLDADAQAKIVSVLSPGGGELSLGRNEFNVLLGLTGLAQEGETASLDGIDERRRSKCMLKPAVDLPTCPACYSIRSSRPARTIFPLYFPHASACTAASPGPFISYL